MKRAVHWGVVGTKEEHGHLVPWCEAGYRAWKKNAFTVQTTVPAGVDCEHCKRGLAAAEKLALPSRVGQWLRIEVTSDDNREGTWTFTVSPHVEAGRIKLVECDGYTREPTRKVAEEVLADLTKRPHTAVYGHNP